MKRMRALGPGDADHAKTSRQQRRRYQMRNIALPGSALFAGLLLASATTLDPALANSWPERSVRIIAPAAGSPADIAARTLGESLSAKWKQPVIIENRPGADNIIAIQALLEARDGHTLLFVTHSAVTVNPLLHAKLPYDPVRDLTPISLVVDDFLGFVVSPSTAAETLQDVVALARRKPGELNVYTVPGSPTLTWLAFQKRTSVSTTFVAYRTPAAAMADLSQGRIDGALVPLAFVGGLLQDGRVKLLAVTNDARSPIAPNTPTLAEQGFPELTFGGLLGLFGGKDMPLELRERISEDIKTALSDSTTIARLTRAGLAPRGTSPGEFASILDEQRAKWSRIAREHDVGPRQ
jgi:tripartite-type tricarboxylate transporter receptor subunit TctC